MPFKFNPLYGTLDLIGSTSGPSGNVTGLPPTTVNAIARWADTGADSIKDSPGTYIQDSGAIEAQGFISNRTVTGTVTVNTGESWIAPALIISAGGMIVLNPDAELILI